MNNLFRGLLAGAGAAKFGGGCLGTVLVFAIIWAVLGQCDGGSHAYLQKADRPAITVCVASPEPRLVYPVADGGNQFVTTAKSVSATSAMR
jgi:hypothetical protein